MKFFFYVTSSRGLSISLSLVYLASTAVRESGERCELFAYKICNRILYVWHCAHFNAIKSVT